MENFDTLLDNYFLSTENDRHLGLMTDLAVEATGFASLEDLANSDMVTDFLDYDENYLEEQDNLHDYHDLLMSNLAEKYIQELDGYLQNVDLTTFQDFSWLYEDFVETTGFAGTERDFAEGLKKSTLFFDYLVSFTTSLE